jgi:hypothetical protein
MDVIKGIFEIILALGIFAVYVWVTMLGMKEIERLSEKPDASRFMKDWAIGVWFIFTFLVVGKIAQGIYF